MAERLQIQSTDPLKPSKPATPLLLPPPQINSPSHDTIDSSNDKQNTTSSSDEYTQNPSKSNHKSSHRRHRHNSLLSYTTSLQPNIPPIQSTPLLNPMQMSVNSAEYPPVNEQSRLSNFAYKYNNKYTPVNTRNRYTTVTTEFFPMQSKSSVTLDQSRTLDIQSENDEDQKIIETIHITRDESIDTDNDTHTHTNNSIDIAKGIPTLPPIVTPVMTAQSVSAYYTPSVTPQSNTSFRRSQFMDRPHRTKSSKLKFTRTKWNEWGKRILINTTARVDRVCHTLVQTRQRFGICPVEMRQLSLTVAVIERAMHGYGTLVQQNKQKMRQSRVQRSSRIHTRHRTPTHKANNNVFISANMAPSASAPHYTLDKESEVNSDDSVETIGKCTNTSIVTGYTYANSPLNKGKLAMHQMNCNKSKSRPYGNLQQFTASNASPVYTPLLRPKTPKPAIAVSRYSEQLAWRHPAGVVSLLEILGGVLRNTEEQLVAIGEIASLTDFVQNNKLIWVISIAAGAYIFAKPLSGPIRYILEQCSRLAAFAMGRIAPKNIWPMISKMIISFVNSITNVLPLSMKRLLNKWIRNVLVIFTNIFKKITEIESVSYWMNRFRFIILPTLIYIIHKIVLKIYLLRLSKLQNQLNGIILHWQLCMTAITPQNRLDQSLSERQKRKKIKQRNKTGNDIDIYQWILRLVPPSAHIDACFWYGSAFQLRLLRKLMDVNYSVACYYYRIFGSSTFFWPLAFPILFYYILNPHRAACRTNEFLANPDIRIIRLFYSILDSKLARWITLKVFPKLRLMPSLKTAITFEIRVDDINAWSYENDGLMVENDADGNKNIKFHNIDTVRIKIFATKKLNIKPDYINSGHGMDGAQFLNEEIQSNLIGNHENVSTRMYPAHHMQLHQTDTLDSNTMNNQSDIDNLSDIDLENMHLLCDDTDTDMDQISNNAVPVSPINPKLINKMKVPSQTRERRPIQKQENGVIFYIHGGGFLANFCASDLRILSQWSELVNAPIVEVDYSLMPSKWPQQLQECILAYKCLCYGRLGFNARRIAVIGDSNGGGLAVSMILNVIQCGLRVPDVLILTSPILSLRQTQPTTSKLLFNMDPVVPMNLIVQLTKCYLIPTICDDENDPLISPLIAAPDYLLSSFPPTTIVVGGLDPFLDDSIDFAHRLTNADVNVECKLKVFKHSPHAFLNFNWILPDVNQAILLIADCIDEAFSS